MDMVLNNYCNILPTSCVGHLYVAFLNNNHNCRSIMLNAVNDKFFHYNYMKPKNYQLWCITAASVWIDEQTEQTNGQTDG